MLLPEVDLAPSSWPFGKRLQLSKAWTQLSECLVTSTFWSSYECVAATLHGSSRLGCWLRLLLHDKDRTFAEVNLLDTVNEWVIKINKLLAFYYSVIDTGQPIVKMKITENLHFRFNFSDNTVVLCWSERKWSIRETNIRSIILIDTHFVVHADKKSIDLAGENHPSGLCSKLKNFDRRAFL